MEAGGEFKDNTLSFTLRVGGNDTATVVVDYRVWFNGKKLCISSTKTQISSIPGTIAARLNGDGEWYNLIKVAGGSTIRDVITQAITSQQNKLQSSELLHTALLAAVWGIIASVTSVTWGETLLVKQFQPKFSPQQQQALMQIYMVARSSLCQFNDFGPIVSRPVITSISPNKD